MTSDIDRYGHGWPPVIAGDIAILETPMGIACVVEGQGDFQGRLAGAEESHGVGVIARQDLPAGADVGARVKDLRDGQAESGQIDAVHLHQPQVDDMTGSDQPSRPSDRLVLIVGVPNAASRIVEDGERVATAFDCNNGIKRRRRDVRRASQKSRSYHRNVQTGRAMPWTPAAGTAPKYRLSKDRAL